MYIYDFNETHTQSSQVINTHTLTSLLLTCLSWKELYVKKKSLMSPQYILLTNHFLAMLKRAKNTKVNYFLTWQGWSSLSVSSWSPSNINVIVGNGCREINELPQKPMHCWVFTLKIYDIISTVGSANNLDCPTFAIKAKAIKKVPMMLMKAWGLWSLSMWTMW